MRTMRITILILDRVIELTERDEKFDRMLQFATLTLGDEGFSGMLDLEKVQEDLYVVEGILGPDGEYHTVSVEYAQISENRAKITIRADVGNAAKYVDMRDCWDYKQIVTFPINQI